MVEEPEQGVHQFVVGRRERDVPNRLVHRHLLSDLPGMVDVVLPRALVLVGRHEIVNGDLTRVVLHRRLNNRLLPLLLRNVPGSGQQRVDAHINGHHFRVIVLVHVEDANQASRDSDQHSCRSVHVVDPSGNGFVGDRED